MRSRRRAWSAAGAPGARGSGKCRPADSPTRAATSSRSRPSGTRRSTACARWSKSDRARPSTTFMEVNMSGPNIRYVIHIAATPEARWEALTSPPAREADWGRIRLSWTVGADGTDVDAAGGQLWRGTVRRSESPRVPTYTFDVPQIGEPPTEVTFELDPPASQLAADARVVRLTLNQTG